MDWTDALEIVVGRTKHERFRALTADDHPDREAWRRRMIEMAEGREPDPAVYPSLPRLAANLAGSLWEWAMSGLKMASEAEQARRLEICRACPEWDGSRCKICGCYTVFKVTMKSEHCPLPEPRW